MNKSAAATIPPLKVLIVAKTRQGSGACIGAISAEGRSLRLIAADAEKDVHTGREYEVGDVWEIHACPPEDVVPPHVENIVVQRKRKLASQIDPRPTIERFMPPKAGGINVLHEGLVQIGYKGTLYIAEKSGIPPYTTLFWRPDAPLYRRNDGKRIRYAYPTEDGDGCTLAFVGFQEPIEVIPAGSLVRVSMSHWWRPKDDPEIELRCYLQLSGWFLPQSASLPEQIFQPPTQNAASQRLTPQRIYESSMPEMPEELRYALPLDLPPEIPGDGYGTMDAPPEEMLPVYEPPQALPAFEATLTGATQLLKNVFGYDSFRPHQPEIIDNVLHRRDTLVIMPTGGGKSLCFQIPALLFDGLTVVVSPLISLMKDQVDTLRELGVAAAFLNSTLSYTEDVSIRQHVRQGRIKLLYVAPETLLRPETLLLVEQSRLAAIAIDEAHCISEWGHDFRPEYRQLVELRHRFPQTVCVALTATATPKVQEDIKSQLRMLEQNTFISSFDRPNLHLTVAPKINILQQTLDFLSSHKDQAGIIYCNTQRQVDQLSEALKAQGLSVSPYHAGLDNGTRQRNQNAFIRDDVRVIVATVAFGMGIDKPDVRFVLHVDLPKDIENYYQQIGRGGRDGLPAECLLLYSYSDVNTILYFIREGSEGEQEGRTRRLQALVDWSESNECRRRPLLDYFGESYTVENCANCDNCQRGKQETTDLTVAAQKFLSCVLRTGERFGTTHIINVLRGSRAKEVLSRGHEKLSTYGIGNEYSTEQWKVLARQMVKGGLMVQDLEFGQLKVLEQGRAVLKGEKFLGVLEIPCVTTSSAEPLHYEVGLFDQLRVKRKELADAANVPPYVIFADRSLQEMATYFPQSDANLAMIYGVGMAKLERYAHEVLPIIRTYCQQHNLQERQKVAAVSMSPRAGLGKKRFEEVGEQFAEGMSVEELMTAWSVTRGTILSHLGNYAQAGHPLSETRLLAESTVGSDVQQRIFALFDEHGATALRPTFDALDGSVGWDELKLLQAVHHLREKA